MPRPDPPDRLDGRSVSRRELTFWYVAAFVTYVVAATFEKGLLTWIIGPLWLVAVVSFGPVLGARLRRDP
ncbi:MAG: hypothetical protein NVSMB4_16790 [Acidimicrobiales bacterium]